MAKRTESPPVYASHSVILKENRARGSLYHLPHSEHCPKIQNPVTYNFHLPGLINMYDETKSASFSKQQYFCMVQIFSCTKIQNGLYCPIQKTKAL